MNPVTRDIPGANFKNSHHHDPNLRQSTCPRCAPLPARPSYGKHTDGYTLHLEPFKVLPRQHLALSIASNLLTHHTLESDVLFIRQRGAKSAKWHLTDPLRPQARVKLAYGSSVQGHELIGKNILDVVKDDKGRDLVLHEPSLADYIVNSARLATPVI